MVRTEHVCVDHPLSADFLPDDDVSETRRVGEERNFVIFLWTVNNLVCVYSQFWERVEVCFLSENSNSRDRVEVCFLSEIM